MKKKKKFRKRTNNENKKLRQTSKHQIALITNGILCHFTLPDFFFLIFSRILEDWFLVNWGANIQNLPKFIPFFFFTKQPKIIFFFNIIFHFFFIHPKIILTKYTLRKDVSNDCKLWVLFNSTGNVFVN